MDGIDMDLDPTTEAMNRIDRVGQTLRTDWSATRDQLSALAGQLGQGELGAAYLEASQRPATETMTAVDDHCERHGRLSATGHECVDLYRSADSRSAVGFDPAVTA
jgi:hypothetical protein